MRGTRRIVGVSVALALALTLGFVRGRAEAGPTDLIGPNFAISSGPTAEPFQGSASDAAYSPITRQFFVVWADNRNAGSTGADIFGRLVNTDGSLAPEFPVSTASGDQVFPTVTYNSQLDQFLVAWTDGRACTPVGFCSDIFGQVINSNGILAGPEFPISTGPRDQRFQDVRYNLLANQFLVVWEDNRISTFAVFGRVTNADGSPATGEFQITAGGSGGNLSRRVLDYDPGNDRFLVAWGGPGSFGQLVNGDGTLSGSNFSMGLMTAPAVAFSSLSSRFLAVAQDTSTQDLFAQLLNADGSFASSAFSVSTAPGAQVAATVIYYSPNDQFLVTWQDGRNSSSTAQTFGQYVNTDGTLAGGEIAIQSAGTGTFFRPGVAYSAETDRFLVVWIDTRTGCCSIFGQLVGAPDKAVFLLIDEDSIDNGITPNFFSAGDVNDDIAQIGLRTPLPFFAANVGSTIVLHTGQVGDEGWFALKTIPPSWDAAGPTSDGLRNYLGNPSLPFPHNVGQGLGTPDASSDREALLDKILDVTPLRATGLTMLKGRQVCAVVYDSDISINYGPLSGSLKGANLGTVAFEVLSVTPLTGFSSSSLPQVDVQILDADEVCEGVLTPFTEAPEPISSSEPFDVVP